MSKSSESFVMCSAGSGSEDVDPPCIVGMACRLPGGINSVSGLWEFLMRKGCAQGPVPPQRFNKDGFYHPNGGSSTRAGLMNVAGGYFLDEDVRTFDNSFFSIHNLEAASMDPQQRKLLEIVFECLEHAGTTLDQISGTNTGVFVGNFTLDHQTMQSRDMDAIHRFSATGCGTTVLANRISHVFNLQGPSFTLDTACSSSLYALHSAIAALERGDCDAAIVAAVNLIMSPEQCVAADKSGVLSPTSTCHTFDVTADGYGRAEGINAIYIKRLSRALRDGDRIWAVVRGTAVNANGNTPGITQPSADLQEAVIRKAYSNACLDFTDSDYVECHGTGTPVGDVVEVEALGRCFAHPGRTEPLLIGSSKPGLGHSEAASGLTALIKVALALDRGKIPPTHGVKILNPKLRLDSLNMKVATEVEDWPRELRRASINAFGYGGANAHAILESPASFWASEGRTTPENMPDIDAHARFLALPVSAASPSSLEIRIGQIREMAETCDIKSLEKLAYALTERISHFNYRSALLARYNGIDEEIQLLNLDEHPSNPQPVGAGSPVAFVFTGQGAQYAGMGKELLRNEYFLASIRSMDHYLQTYLPPEYAPDWTLESAILDPPEVSQIHQVGHSQPVCTAIQIALVDLFRGWNVRPCAVVGHSSGEIAAAYAAGFLSAPQAILTAYFRGYAVAQLTKNGAMLAAGIHTDAAKKLIQKTNLDGEVSVACINSPESVTLSGSVDGITHMMTEIQKQGNFARMLRTGNRAYHSFMMKEAGELYEKLLIPYLESKDQDDGQTESLTTEMYSSVITNSENETSILEGSSMSARYWRDNLEKPVQFDLALSTLLNKWKRVHLIEIGPNPALKGPVQQIRSHLKRDHVSVPYSCTLVRGQNAEFRVKQLAGLLFVYNQKLAWKGVNCSTAQTFASDLPPYPWDYSAGLLWQEPRASVELRNRQHLRHELLGSLNVAGNGIDRTWRNVLCLDEIPWVRDHKLESQIVFPASCYLAMAIEALSQTRTMSLGGEPMVEFRHVNISTALAIPDDKMSNGLELHTTLSPQKLSGTSVSDGWNEFSISTLVAGQATRHCSGNIRILEDPNWVTFTETVAITKTKGFEEWPNMGIWYDRFANRGLRFGPNFQSVTRLRTDSGRFRREATGATRLVPAASEGANSTSYLIHPITIDACIQVAIMGSAAGDVSETQVYLPVFIDECHIRAVTPDDYQALGLVQAISSKTSPSTLAINSTLWFTDATAKPLVNLRGVRVTQYKASIAQEPLVPRQPCLRVRWKPDILHLHTGVSQQLDRYIAEFVAERRNTGTELADDEYLAAIGALVDLSGHRNPRMRVLEVGDDCQYRSKILLELLGEGTGFRRCKSWQHGRFDDSGVIKIQGSQEGGKGTSEEPFDLLFVDTSQGIWESVDLFHLLVADQGFVVTRSTAAAREALQQGPFTVIDLPDSEVILAARIPAEDTVVLGGHDLIIIVPNSSLAVRGFAENLRIHLQHGAGIAGFRIVTLRDIDRDQLRQQTIFISLLELEHEFLASIDQYDLELLHNLTDTATTIIWMSGTNMLSNSLNPDLSLSNGLSRSLMLEQPSLNFVILDVGPITGQDDTTYRNVVQVLKSCCDNGGTRDKEFAQKDELLYISRFEPEFDMNLLFRRRFEKYDALTKIKLSTAHPVRLAISNLSGSDTLHFEQVREPTSATPDGFIDVLVKSISLNAKDVYTLKGRVETREATTALEFSGVVNAVGPDVAHLQPGDNVVVGMPCHFATLQRVPVWAAHKMLPGEQYAVMATFPTIYGTALYGLVHRARLRVGESVLIHGGAGAFGFAAITIAKHILGTTTNIYTTAGSHTKRRFIATELGIPEENIFHSRNGSFAAGIKSATRKRGVDVVVNFLTGDLLQTSWECVAPFGRFVEIGKRDLINAGRLDMRVFLRNATFTAFDFSDLYYEQMEHRDITFSRLLAEIFSLYRSGKIQPPPITVFGADEVIDAYRYFSSKDRLGKVVISLEQEDNEIPVAHSQYLTLFDPQKVYLMVGCLGGLGRSLSRWMVARGARSFVFLGRSACDKRSAKELVSRIEEAGASVKVVRGDVISRSDVDAAISACRDTGNSLGGVVQAAMGLHEALFAKMGSSDWHTAIQPKWKGTWNLHNALQGHDKDLDFFLLTSSLSGSVGTATESNYCAANSFLDAFARWRHIQGKPAVSVGLGMISGVGYLHENPDIEALLLRKGIQPLNEAEFLQVIDLALAGVAEGKNNDKIESAHILTGLEPLGFRQLMQQGFDVSFSSAQDPRLAILAAALAAEQDAEKDRLGGATRGEISVATSKWLGDVPVHALGSLAPEADADSLQVAILRLVRKRFSSLILTPTDQIDDNKPLARFGVDSMIASEFRTWFWTTFKVDVPFLDILSPEKNLSTLAEFARTRLLDT